MVDASGSDVLARLAAVQPTLTPTMARLGDHAVARLRALADAAGEAGISVSACGRSAPQEASWPHADTSRPREASPRQEAGR